MNSFVKTIRCTDCNEHFAKYSALVDGERYLDECLEWEGLETTEKCPQCKMSTPHIVRVVPDGCLAVGEDEYL